MTVIREQVGRGLGRPARSVAVPQPDQPDDDEAEGHELGGRDAEERPVVPAQVLEDEPRDPYQTKKIRSRSPEMSLCDQRRPSQIRTSAPMIPEIDSYRNSGWKYVGRTGYAEHG